MITLRKASERGRGDHGWLKSWHSFSFADYYDPEHTQFSSLRVINDDTVEAGQGFGTHGHRDMEILSYVLSGSLQHKDSMGNGKVMTYGEVLMYSDAAGFNVEGAVDAELLLFDLVSRTGNNET